MQVETLLAKLQVVTASPVVTDRINLVRMNIQLNLVADSNELGEDRLGDWTEENEPFREWDNFTEVDI